jgi:uncharacterized membrane protein HdeD (DUF308 family)
MTTLETGFKRASQASLVLSIVLIFFGVLAITLPMATSVGVVIVIGWIAVLDGIVQLVHAFQSKGIGHIAWKLLVAVVYIVAGGYFIAHPVLATATFTLVLGIFLVAEGVADVVAYFATRKSGSSAVDAAGWNCYSISGFLDLESVARQFVVGYRDIGGHQHDYDRHYAPDDDLGGS